MTTTSIIFTRHEQVDTYLQKCFANGINMENHTFQVSTALMRKYFNNKDPVIEKWKSKYELTVCCTLHSQRHDVIVQCMDEADENDWRQDIETLFKGNNTLSNHDDVVYLFKLCKRLNIPIKNRCFYIDNTLRNTYISGDASEIQQWLQEHQLVINNQNNQNDQDRFQVTIEPENPYHLWNIVQIGNDNQTYLDEYNPDDQNDNYYNESDTTPLLGLRQRIVKTV
jgi:hypothetical protein